MESNQNANNNDFELYDYGVDDGQSDDGYRNINQNNMSNYSNAEKFLDEFDNEEREGFKVEVKRPDRKANKSQPTSSGKKKFGH